MVVKVLDGTGQGRTSDVIRALEFVVANKAKLNAQIINLSLGHPIYAPAIDDPLVQAVQKATAAGYDRCHLGRQRGDQRDERAPGLRRCLVAVQRALGDLCWCRQHAEFSEAQRRCRGSL